MMHNDEEFQRKSDALVKSIRRAEIWALSITISVAVLAICVGILFWRTS